MEPRMEIIETYRPGDFIIEEGSKGTSAYVILSGTAKVFKRAGNKDVLVATLENGEVFGEMGLIEDRPRSASVKAVSPLKVRVIDREQFNELLKINPSTLIPIIKNLFERLRQASEMLAEKDALSYQEIKDSKEYEIILEGQTREAKKVLDHRKLLISKFPFLIGRYVPHDPDSDVLYHNDLVIYEEKPYVISRHHLSINKEVGLLWVVDRGSAFGVIVNGKEIGGSTGVSRALLDKDENQVVIGPATSRYIFLLKKNIT
jgi:CRP/FNR family transcriptional regulator, cyclic AMP receptor protein